MATMVLIALFILAFLPFSTKSNLERDRALFRYTAVPCELTRGEPLTLAEIRRLSRFDEIDACGYQASPRDLPMSWGPDEGRAPTEQFAEGKRLWLSVPASLFFHLGWLHLVTTLWALWIFGDNVEARLGWPLFVALFLISGLAGVLSNVFINTDSILPTVGPGGAVAGIIGCYMILFPDNTVKVWAFPAEMKELSAVNFTIVWLGLQVLFAIFAQPVSWASTFVGFGVGISCGIATRLITRRVCGRSLRRSWPG